MVLQIRLRVQRHRRLAVNVASKLSTCQLEHVCLPAIRIVVQLGYLSAPRRRPVLRQAQQAQAQQAQAEALHQL